METPRARILMTCLGSNGRFGNQLLQYAFVRLYAAEHNLVAELPERLREALQSEGVGNPCIPAPSIY